MFILRGKDSVSDIVRLAEQTTYLIEKQQESREYTVEAFNAFLAAIESRKQEVETDQEKEKLQNVHDSVSEQSEQFASAIDDDVAFLESQLEAIKKIEEHDDEAKAAELTSLLLDGQEVPPTEEFKKEVEQEADAAKRHFLAVIDDLRNALDEGGYDDLLVYFQNMEDGEEGEEIGQACCSGSGSCGGKCTCNENCGCESPTA